MSRNTIDNLENLANNLDQRKAVFVDEYGQIHDAQKMGELADHGEEKPVTQVKPTTWYIGGTKYGHAEQVGRLAGK